MNEWEVAMADKRQSKRRIKRLSLEFLNNGEKYRGRVSNLSKTGIFVKTRKPLEPESPVTISLNIDEGNGLTIDLEGIVVRKIKEKPLASKSIYVAHKNGMGVRLTRMPQEYHDLISNLQQRTV